MLDWQGRVAECASANIFFIRDGRIHTPIADCFLAGITRATVIDLARRRGIEVIERRIMPEELSDFTECFITGTAAEVTPVSEVGPWKFSPGRISAQLMADYTAEVHSRGQGRRGVGGCHIRRSAPSPRKRGEVKGCRFAPRLVNGADN